MEDFPDESLQPSGTPAAEAPATGGEEVAAPVPEFTIPDDFELSPPEEQASQVSASSPPVPPPAGQDAADPLGQAKRMFEEKLLSGNAGEAFTLAAMLGAKMAEQNITTRLDAQAAMTARAAIETELRAKARENPHLFRAVEKELRQRLSAVPDEALAHTSPAQVIAGVQYEFERAAGKAFLSLQNRKAAAPAPAAVEESEPPPDYNPVTPRKRAAAPTRTEQQKMTVTLAKLAGLTDEEAERALDLSD